MHANLYMSTKSSPGSYRFNHHLTSLIINTIQYTSTQSWLKHTSWISRFTLPPSLVSLVLLLSTVPNDRSFLAVPFIQPDDCSPCLTAVFIACAVSKWQRDRQLMSPIAKKGKAAENESVAQFPREMLTRVGLLAFCVFPIKHGSRYKVSALSRTKEKNGTLGEKRFTLLCISGNLPRRRKRTVRILIMCRTNEKHGKIAVMMGIERLIYRKKCPFSGVWLAAKIFEYDNSR